MSAATTTRSACWRAGAGGRAGGLADEPHPTATSALISEADREIDLEVTGLETIPKIEPEQGQHDLAQVEPRADADGVLEPRGGVLLIAARARQVVAILVAGGQERGVAAVEERQAARRESLDREQRHRVLGGPGRAHVAAADR